MYSTLKRHRNGRFARRFNVQYTWSVCRVVYVSLKTLREEKLVIAQWLIKAITLF